MKIGELENLPYEMRLIMAVINVTEDMDEAKELIRAFIEAYPEYNPSLIYDAIESSSSRFVGWRAAKTVEYDYSNVSGYSLYLSKDIANFIKNNKAKMKLVIEG